MDLNTVTPLFLRCVKLLPLKMEDYMTDYEVVCHLVQSVNELIENQDKILEVVGPTAEVILELQKEIAFIEGELEKIKNGEYMDVYINALACWINNNLICLVGRIAKYVIFGLDENGYFYADVPSPWCIGFDTIVSPGPDYGRLVLTY